MVTPDQGRIPPEWERWRGGIDAILAGIQKKQIVVENKLDRNSETLSKMPDEIEKRMAKVINGQAAAPTPGPGQPITFKWLAQNALLPIVMLIAGLMIAQVIAG